MSVSTGSFSPDFGDTWRYAAARRALTGRVIPKFGWYETSAKSLGRTLLGRALALFWMAGNVVGMRTTAGRWNIPSKCEPYGELFFFLIQKEQTICKKTADGACIGRRDPVGSRVWTNDGQCMVLTSRADERPNFRRTLAQARSGKRVTCSPADWESLSVLFLERDTNVKLGKRR